jgi:hypothetical protein
MTIKLDDYRDILGEEVDEVTWRKMKAKIKKRVAEVKEETGFEALAAEVIYDVLLTSNYEVE